MPNRLLTRAKVLFQIPLNAEPPGIAVFLLQLERGVNRSEIDLAPWVVRGARQIDQQRLRTFTLLRLLSRAAQPFTDGLARDPQQLGNPSLRPALPAESDHLQTQRLRIGRDRIANELLKLGMSPEEEAFAESFDCMVIEPMSGEIM
jgi:hypothetical protein